MMPKMAVTFDKDQLRLLIVFLRSPGSESSKSDDWKPRIGAHVMVSSWEIGRFP
jgi:hypothetical protein